MWFYHYMRQLKRWNFNATHHITIIWRAISNQTPIRFLQIASEKSGLKMRSKIFMTPCYLILSQNSKPVIIEKTKKNGKLLTHNPILFDSAINYHMIIWTILPKYFWRFVGICGNYTVWLCFFNEHFCGQRCGCLCIFNQYLYAVFDIVHIFRNSNLPPFGDILKLHVINSKW